MDLGEVVGLSVGDDPARQIGAGRGVGLARGVAVRVPLVEIVVEVEDLKAGRSEQLHGLGDGGRTRHPVSFRVRRSEGPVAMAVVVHEEDSHQSSSSEMTRANSNPGLL